MTRGLGGGLIPYSNSGITGLSGDLCESLVASLPGLSAPPGECLLLVPPVHLSLGVAFSTAWGPLPSPLGRPPAPTDLSVPGAVGLRGAASPAQ